ncbi:hypothetical protein ACMFMG_000513 [Clarireedia jacksonii]
MSGINIIYLIHEGTQEAHTLQHHHHQSHNHKSSSLPFVPYIHTHPFPRFPCAINSNSNANPRQFPDSCPKHQTHIPKSKSKPLVKANNPGLGPKQPRRRNPNRKRHDTLSKNIKHYVFSHPQCLIILNPLANHSLLCFPVSLTPPLLPKKPTPAPAVEFSGLCAGN